MLAGELRGARVGLDAFGGEDKATDLRAVFSWSYQALSAGAARLFRLLGVHPGPDVGAPAVASLAGVPRAEVRPLLAELTRSHLLAERTPGRYSLHDLHREYAGELARTVDSGAARRAAEQRMLDHYLHTAVGASLCIVQHHLPITPSPARPGVTPEHPDDREAALAWFSVERPVLLAAIHRAADGGFDRHAWQLTWALSDFLNRQVHWHEWAAAQTVALQAALRLDDRSAWVHAHLGLARALSQLGRHQEAEEHFQRSLDLCVELGDQAGQALTHLNLGSAHAWQGDHAAALDHSRQALDLYRTASSRTGQAIVLNNMGWSYAQLGDHAQAIAHCQRALSIQQELGDRNQESATWDSLGYAHHQLGHHRQAIACYRHALDLCRQLGDRHHEPMALERLGDAHHAAGDDRAARDAWRAALAVLDDLGHPDAGRLRAKLAGSGQPAV